MSHIKIEEGRYGRSIISARRIARHEVIFLLTGQLVDAPNKHTIQITEENHLDPLGADWRLINHSCMPNLRADIEHRRMIALIDIDVGRELTFNYLSTEWSLSSPFVCVCGAPGCPGEIRGYRFLDFSQRSAIRHLLSEHLARRFDASEGIDEKPLPSFNVA